MGDGQAVGLGSGLETAVVVGITPTAILYAVLIVEIVDHLMEKRCSDLFNRPRKRSRTDVNLVSTAQLGDPGVVSQGKWP